MIRFVLVKVSIFAHVGLKFLDSTNCFTSSASRWYLCMPSLKLIKAYDGSTELFVGDTKVFYYESFSTPSFLD